MLIPIERGLVFYRAQSGLAPKYHSRLIQGGRTLSILQADTQEEADARAWRLAEVLLPNDPSVRVEHAS